MAKKRSMSPKYYVTTNNIMIWGVRYDKGNEYTGEHIAFLLSEGAICTCNSTTKKKSSSVKCPTC